MSCFFTGKAKEIILNSPAKTVLLSGPSGFLGSRVFESILHAHMMREEAGVEPGEVILLSGSPGRLMGKLYEKYGTEKMKTVRASRVDYFKQHDTETWIDHLGSLGCEGENAVFLNLAAVAGPVDGKPDAMMHVNYHAPAAAAKACEYLGFGHWIQSSTQATNSERAGQVPYSRAKGMADYALLRTKVPITVACLGLLYSKDDATIGQERSGQNLINLIDLALLPLTPIMGDGSAPLQPQEIKDASIRFAYLALTDPSLRPNQPFSHRISKSKCASLDHYRYYDAVGPETISILEMLKIFAEAQGNKSFRPVFIGYRNMEQVLNIQSLGNLNRQFVSLLRSEQDTAIPFVGDPTAWEGLMNGDHPLSKLEDALNTRNQQQPDYHKSRMFPYLSTLYWVYKHPKVIPPGIALSLEIIHSFLFNRNQPQHYKKILTNHHQQQQHQSNNGQSTSRK